MALDRSKVIQQAQRFVSRGQYEEAVLEWKKLAAEAPHDGSIHDSIGELHLKRNAIVEATAAFLLAAAAYEAEGATLQAIAAYKKVLKCDPNAYEVYRHLGDLNAERGLVSSAVQDYLTLATHYLKKWEAQKALALYQKIVDLDPSNVNAKESLAKLYLQENRLVEAAQVYVQLGRTYLSEGAYEAAKHAYCAVLNIDPTNSEAAQFVESVESVKNDEAGSVSPNGAASPENQSHLLDDWAQVVRKMDEEQYDEAEAILNQMLSQEPGSPLVCQLLARLHLKRGDLTVALGEYRFLIGEALRARDLLLAESLIKEFLSVQPDSVPLLELQGRLYEEKNDPASAAVHYAKAFELLLVHPEPGMEGYHEELLEKVRSLSGDQRLVERLASMAKGTPAPASSDAPPS